MDTPFVDRERELAALEGFWASGRAQCIPVIGRRRVGKTFLLEHFAQGRRVVYHRCQLRDTPEQLQQLGAALASLVDDPILQAQPPATWPAIFATVERLTQSGRLLLVLDEVPYWVTRDESMPSTLQNWWDEQGRRLDLMLVLCGSAVQMMERLLSGPAPLAGCITGRLPIRPLDFRAAAQLLGFADPVDNLTAYGILGGAPLYLSFFLPDRTIRENVLQAIASPSARLYVEPQALFAAHHRVYDSPQALGVLRAIAQRKHQWSDIVEATKLSPASLRSILDTLVGDLGLIERMLPVTETHQTRTYYTQYHLTDNFIRFWFEFIEPNQGNLEFGDAERAVDSILARLPGFMGPAFEAMCRDWTRLASAAGALPVRAGRVGTWWNTNHQIDVVGLDEHGKVAVAGESKWQNEPFGWEDLTTYLGHVRALEDRVRPDASHLLFAKSGFTRRVEEWADETRAMLLRPMDLLAPYHHPPA